MTPNNRDYHRRSDAEVGENLQFQQDNNLTDEAAAKRIGLPRSYWSLIRRGLARADAPGPRSGKRNAPALTKQEEQEIFVLIEEGERHFGKRPSFQAIAEQLGRDPASIRRATERIVAWFFRLWSYIKKTPDCWVWSGGVARDRGADIPRFMNGAHKRVDPRRYVLEFATKTKLLPAQRLKQTCGNTLCCRPEHQEIVRRK